MFQHIWLEAESKIPMIKKLSLLGGLSLALSCGLRADETAFINAATGLENHVNGSAPLTLAQINLRRNNLRNNADNAGDSVESITAAFSYLTAYENRNQPIFRDEFPRNLVNNINNALRQSIFDLHQAIVDDVYNAANLADPTIRAMLDGRKFETADNFPGQVNPPASSRTTYSVQINASQPEMFGYEVQFGREPARRPTGAYLTPGTIATVTVPANLVGKGFEVRVGAHVANLQNRPNNYKRLNRVSLTYPINSVTTEIVSPLGGGIYIEVPYEVEEGLATIQFQKYRQSPFLLKYSSPHDHPR